MSGTYAFFVDLLSGGAVTALAVVFVVVAALLYFIFRLFKRSVKMALRLALVAAVLIIAVMAGFAVWWFGSGAKEKPKPPPSANRSR